MNPIPSRNKEVVPEAYPAACVLAAVPIALPSQALMPHRSRLLKHAEHAEQVAGPQQWKDLNFWGPLWSWSQIRN